MFDYLISLAEEQRDAPQTGETDQGEDNAADGGGLTAKEPADEIEAENTDRAPVERADNAQDKSNSVHHYNDRSFLRGRDTEASAGCPRKLLIFIYANAFCGYQFDRKVIFCSRAPIMHEHNCKR